MAPTFYVDECVDARVAHGFRPQGVDLVSVHELGLLGAPDRVHLTPAIEAGRVTFTNDHNFLGLVNAHIQSGATFPGMIFAESTLSIDRAVRGTLDVVEILDPRDMTNHIKWGK